MQPKFKAWVTEPEDKTSDKYANVNFPCMIDVLTLNMYEDGYEVEGFMEYDPEMFVRSFGNGFKLRQSTNLFDREGEEIYEGALMKNMDCPLAMAEQEGYIWEVVYKAPCFLIRQGNKFNEIDIATYHVIGNIHEHPHLLENTEIS